MPCQRLCKRSPDPLERDPALTVRSDAPKSFDDVCSGLSRRGDLRDVQLRADV